jgi:spermidine/putrescine transport system ATP-binding protein
MSADVDLDHLTIRFSGCTAVKSVNMKINGGEFFSILGPSGCGKTTLLRTISGFAGEGQGRLGAEVVGSAFEGTSPTWRYAQRMAGA